MSELPWLKFYADKWLAGSIQFQPLEYQSVFMNIIALQWKNQQPIAKQVLSVRYPRDRQLIEDALVSLQDANLIEIIVDHINVKFISEQLGDNDLISKRRAENGRKGGLAKAKQVLASAKQNVAEEKRVEQNREEENRIDESNPFTHPQEPIDIDPSTEWHQIKSQAWVQSIKKKLGKIGANNWQEWTGVVDNHSLEMILSALPDIKADDRWPSAVDEKIYSQSALDKVSAINGAKGFFG